MDILPELQIRIERLKQEEEALQSRPKLPKAIDTLGDLSQSHADIEAWHQAQWRSLLPLDDDEEE